MGPGLGGLPATSGVISVDSNMMDARQLGGWHEKVGVTLLRSTCVVQMKESLWKRSQWSKVQGGSWELGGDGNLKGF